MLDVIQIMKEQCLCPISTSETLNTVAPCASGFKPCWKMFDAESAWVRILQVDLFLSRKLLDGSWSQRELPSVFIWEGVLQDIKKLWVLVQIPTSGRLIYVQHSSMWFLCENVLWTKCCQFPTFVSFLGLDVSSDCKNTEKLEKYFQLSFMGYVHAQKW